MFEWLSDNRATVAAIIIIALLMGFISSILVALRRRVLYPEIEVFGDP